MKSDEDVRMISAEAPVLFAKVCWTMAVRWCCWVGVMAVLGMPHCAGRHRGLGLSPLLCCRGSGRCLAACSQSTADFPRGQIAWVLQHLSECSAAAPVHRMSHGLQPANNPRSCPHSLPAKACEYFILELTLRAWNAAEETKRRTLQRSDIATAIARTDIFDFLVKPLVFCVGGWV